MRAGRGRRWKRLLLAGLVLTGLVGWLYSLDSRELEVSEYTLHTEKLSQDLRIALLSDLHNAQYGEENQVLIGKIAAYQPHMILMCGDMVQKDDPDVSVVLELCEALTEVAEIYYIYGNHEGFLQYDPKGCQVPLDGYLTDRGVNLLYGGVYEIPHGQGTIHLLARSADAEDYRENPAMQATVAEFMEADAFKLVMTHYPDLIWDALAEMQFDLGVAGHYHGGQVIIPGLGGLYHSDTGFFPEYYAGQYQLRYGNLILSRGLGNGTPFPRINNAPELVFINVKTDNSTRKK